MAAYTIDTRPEDQQFDRYDSVDDLPYDPEPTVGTLATVPAGVVHVNGREVDSGRLFVYTGFMGWRPVC